MPKRIIEPSYAARMMAKYPPNETPSMPMPSSERAKRMRQKRIEAHTDDELDAAIAVARIECDRVGLDFWKILHGVDAYMHRRRRRDDRRAAESYVEEMLDVWGDN